jgi:hypothetical protein
MHLQFYSFNKNYAKKNPDGNSTGVAIQDKAFMRNIFL